MNTFRELSATLQQIRETRGNNAKISICANYLKKIKDDNDLYLAARFIGEGAFDDISGNRASAGSRTTGQAASLFCEIDYKLVFKPCRTATGSNSETIEKLMYATPAGREKRTPADLSLQDISAVFGQISKLSTRADKQQVFIETWKKMTPVEIKYFVRLPGQGSLRIGFETRSLISAIAKAFQKDVEAVRYAHMITGSTGKTAVLAKNNDLNKAEFNLFHPLSFMLASPVEAHKPGTIENYVGEEKFDGMRCQLHVNNQQVKLFSRDLNDITTSFPDLVTFFQSRNLPSAVLDGEICVFKNQTIKPFQLLQKRMGVKKPGRELLKKFPVLFIAYDLLFIEGTTLFNNPLYERREKLIKLSEKAHIPITRQFEIDDYDHLDECFNKALSHGNEGLMLKKRDSTYEYGQRRKSWLKVKKPGGSFDTVIMYAHAGSGKRGGMYSNFTLGVSVKDDERYEEEFIPIGKAYGGYTDEELKKLNDKIKELTVEKYGPTLGLLPQLVVEVEFDGIQINKRTKAGYTLRLPRFKAIRHDLGPQDTDTLKDVEAFYTNTLEKNHTIQGDEPSFLYKIRKPQID